MQQLIVNRMREKMRENTRQIISFKNLVGQITEEHLKTGREFEDEKEKFRKSTQSYHTDL